MIGASFDSPKTLLQELLARAHRGALGTWGAMAAERGYHPGVATESGLSN